MTFLVYFSFIFLPFVSSGEVIFTSQTVLCITFSQPPCINKTLSRCSLKSYLTWSAAHYCFKMQFLPQIVVGMTKRCQSLKRYNYACSLGASINKCKFQSTHHLVLDKNTLHKPPQCYNLLRIMLAFSNACKAN